MFGYVATVSVVLQGRVVFGIPPSNCVVTISSG
jgi:hypothetical protein